MQFFGTKDIKNFVDAWILNSKSFAGKKVLDIPAGSGHTSALLKEQGADVYAYDIFPELFLPQNIVCQLADLGEKIPVDSESFDDVICQEGIEHMTDQFKVLKELARVLKKQGRLILTTPNYSNLRSRFSFLVGESEYFGKSLPPHVLNSVWLSQKEKIYFGHLFLTGFFKLKLLAELVGFELVEWHATRVNYTSLILFPLFYPFIFIFNLKAYLRESRKLAKEPNEKNVLWQSFKWSIHPSPLLSGHLFLEFKKQEESNEGYSKIFKSKYENTNFKT